MSNQAKFVANDPVDLKVEIWVCPELAPASGSEVWRIRRRDSKGNFVNEMNSYGQWQLVGSGSFWLDEAGAHEFCGEYLKGCENNKDSSKFFPYSSKGLKTVSALTIDTNSKMLKYKCPSCQKQHFTRLRVTGTYVDINTIIPRKCPETAEIIEVLMRDASGWRCNASNIKESMNDLYPDEVPKQKGVCPECKGTGKYIGFTKIEPCSQGCLSPS